MSTEGQLRAYLQDAHAIELQALEQMRRAPKVAGDDEIAAAFSDHLGETERHVRYVEARLEAQGWAPVPQKDLAAKLSGVGMALFARFAPDSPGKLAVHGYAYERMELATYDVLTQLAERVGDAETAMDARSIAGEERAMAERLASLFDRAVDASLRAVEPDGLDEQLDKYLADAHAIESQAAQLLEGAPDLAEVSDLASVYEEHLEETRHHRVLVEERLRARGAKPSALKDTALRAGAMNLSLAFKAQVDTPVKLAVFSYAFEHLEIAAYELLRRVAGRAGDGETVLAIDGILVQERGAAARIQGLFAAALDASLERAGVDDEKSGAGYAGPAPQP